MRLLDLFCGAGGCSVGYHRAGFEVVGVDYRPMPRYPFEFHQADALEFLREHGSKFDVIHASPPCQCYTAMISKKSAREKHPDMVAAVRKAILEAKPFGPYVIENVMRSPLRNAILLCGTNFGLRVIRHRLFECYPLVLAPGDKCNHPPRGTVGRAGYADNKKVGDWISVAGHHPNQEAARFAMGIDWMSRNELAQAIPPVYTEYIGKQLRNMLCNRSDLGLMPIFQASTERHRLKAGGAVHVRRKK